MRASTGSDISRGNQILLLDNGPVHTFLREHLLNWLEALKHDAKDFGGRSSNNFFRVYGYS